MAARSFSLLLTVLVGVASSQVASRLYVVNSIPIGSQGPTPVLLPAKCDNKGNVYARFVALGSPSIAPVVRLSRDASKRTVFDLLAEAGRGQWFIADFSFDESHVFELTQDKTRVAYFLTKFSEDGHLQSSTQFKLRDGVDLLRLAALSGGRSLVAGFDHGRKGHTARPFAALFDDDGNLLKELHLKVAPTQRKQVPQLGPQSSDEPLPGDDISLGSVLGDERADVYLVRHTLPVEVSAIDASGRLRRRYTISPPFDNASPRSAQLDGTHLVVEFAKPILGGDEDEVVFRVVDANTGERVADYEQEPGRWGAFACSEAGQFVFLSSDQGIESLVREAPE